MGCAGLQGSFDPADDAALTMFVAAAAAEVNFRSFHCDYALARRLGRGAFGAVYSATRSAGRERQSVAVKVVDTGVRSSSGRNKGLDRKRLYCAVKEAAVLRSLPTSDHVVQFRGFYSDGPFTYIVMERCASGLLPFFLQMSSVTEESMKCIFRDMLAGISVCHAAGIAHRDVKHDNFLVACAEPGASNDGTGAKIKLCDFGLASRVSAASANELSGVVGTPSFMAPEMLSGAPYGVKVDVWALGALAYSLLFGSWPYSPSEDSGPAMKLAISSGSSPPSFRSRPDLTQISAPCCAWVEALLERDAERRPSAEDALAHPALLEPWADGAEASLMPAINEAVRLGAFELGDTHEQSREMDHVLQALNSKRHVGGFRSRKATSAMRRATMLLCL